MRIEFWPFLLPSVFSLLQDYRCGTKSLLFLVALNHDSAVGTSICIPNCDFFLTFYIFIYLLPFLSFYLFLLLSFLVFSFLFFSFLFFSFLFFSFLFFSFLFFLFLNFNISSVLSGSSLINVVMFCLSSRLSHHGIRTFSTPWIRSYHYSSALSYCIHVLYFVHL